jgi:hypothetical protein
VRVVVESPLIRTLILWKSNRVVFDDFGEKLLAMFKDS